MPSKIAKLIRQVEQHYQRALEHVKGGDWAGYGAEMEALETVLDKMAKLIAGQRQ